MLRFILKIIAMPFALAFTITAAFFSFVLSASSVFFGIASSLIFVGSVILFITGEPMGGATFMVIAFLVSPFGIPAVAGRLVGAIGNAGGSLRGFIAG